jgi:hypothetical protein
MFARSAFLAESGIPHNAFEGELFDQWIQSVRALQTHEKFMSTRTVTDTALPVLDELLYRDAVADLHFAKAVCAVTDGWTSSDGLFWRGVMFHWVGEDWTLHTHGSDFFPITSRVAEAEALQLNEVIQRTLNQDQIVGYCVTDGAERRMCEEVPVDNWWCVDHRLHNVVVNARKHGASGELYDYVQWLCSLVSKTTALSGELERRRKCAGHSRLGVLTSSETRWNSLFMSADRLLEVWGDLVDMAKANLFAGHLPPEDKKHPDKVRLEPGDWLTPTNRDMLFECQRLLCVLADASTELEGEGYQTLSLVPKCIDRIFRHLRKTGTVVTAGAEQFRGELLSKMNHYFPRFFEEPNPALMAARLDYRFCRLKWCKPKVIDAIDASIASEAVALKDEADRTTTEDLLL